MDRRVESEMTYSFERFEEYGERSSPEDSAQLQLGMLKERRVMKQDASLNQVLRHYRIKK
jgi:hypothetical protein